MNAKERKEQLARRKAAYERELKIAMKLHPIGSIATSITDDDPIPVTGTVTGYTPSGCGKVLVVLDGRGKDGIEDGWASYLNELM